ncbi:hypothetical protein HPB49_012494 [Dermacentor silvarum]|uniref:Uncharacterized protein n=1 Tax=Dermacentor silvarum TaxID=543639 RepID=A0ACB8C962_DERSI|nr:hypothetical protein HPB49_012494 [Dermacentor silvarum]
MYSSPSSFRSTCPSGATGIRRPNSLTTDALLAPSWTKLDFSVAEVRQAIFALNRMPAPGPDEVTNLDDPDKFGGEQTLTLEVFPEFKRYNVSLWKSHGGECGDTASLNMVSWKHEYLEADPITVRCFPSEFCSRLTTSTFHIKGGIFETGDDVLEMAFSSAVDRINTMGLGEPGAQFVTPGSRLLARVEHTERLDSFQASRKVCALLEEGVAAVFGPQSGEASAAVRSACAVLDVPHMETRWDYRVRPDNHSVNLFPHPVALGKAYLDFIKFKDWRTFAVLYEEN